MKIIITMSGEGSRFKNIGFNKPKHEIIAKNKTLFEWSLLSLKDFFSYDFIFIVRKNNYNKKFIDDKVDLLQIKNYEICEINDLTDGQASTVMLADEYINDNDEILIYNIDTYIEEEVLKKEMIKPNMSGIIPTFIAEGDKWSFTKFDENKKVIEVSEKKRISDYGTVGLYYFKEFKKFKEILVNFKKEIMNQYSEAYIAPMYKYLIESKIKFDNEVYATVIESKKIHVLGTPEDIKNFDKDYEKKNFPSKKYIEFLNRNMDFIGLQKFYEEEIMKDSNLILEYIIFLSNTGQIEDIKKIIKKYNINKLIKKNKKFSKITDVKKIVNTFEKKKKWFWKLKSSNNINETYENFSAYKFDELQEFLIKNKKKYFSLEKKICLEPILVEYITNELIKEKLIKEELIKTVVYHVADTKYYNAQRKKYLFTVLFSYAKENFENFFVFQNFYNHNQKFHYILEGFDYDYFEPGIRKNLNELTKLHNLDKINYKYNIIEKETINKKTKIALCISGSTRFDINRLLKEFSKKTALDTSVDIDVFIFSWDTKEDYAGLSGLTIDPKFQWVNKYFKNIEAKTPGDIKTIGGFRKTLPTVAKLFETPIKSQNHEKIFSEVFPNANIKLVSEKSFEEKYNKKSFIRRNNLNQAKMFYCMHECNKMVEESEQSYDFIIRARPDWVPYDKINFQDFQKIKEDELGMNRNPLVGPTDLMFFGRYKTMMKLTSLWEYAQKMEDLSFFKINGTKIDCESHRLLDLWMFSNKLITNTKLKLTYSNYIASNSINIIPNFEKALKEDVKHYDELKQKEYIKFFKELKKGKNFSQ